jgi:spore germination cell wall hydrolase CwlJ-like protein
MFKFAFILLAFVSVTAFTNPTPIHLHPVSIVLAKEIQCMTDNIYREAPDESYAGKIAVGTVVMNRVKTQGFAKTVCGVIYQRGQFTWTSFKHLPAPDPTLYAEAHRIALEVIKEGKRLKTLGNALYYHRIDCAPHWDHVRAVATIGNHVFFVASRN